MLPAIPTPLPMPFAQNGERRAIPETNTVLGSADASWSTGFPPVTRINKQAGGKPPYGLDFQGIFHTICQHLFFAQSGGVYPWMGANAATGFPGLNYLFGAHVLGSDGNEYVALQPSGPDVPNTAGAGFVGPVDPVGDAENKGGYWSKIFNGGPDGGVVGGGSGHVRGEIFPVYRATFGGSDGRRPIFWGETDADERYVLCDGGSDGDGGTVPDLRGRMILGASDAYPAGSTGGSATHKHSLSGTVGATTLTVEQMPSHTHSESKVAYNYGNHIQYGAGGMGWRDVQTGSTGGSQSHTHSLAASSGDAVSLPPYYALSYIMRIA